MITYEEYLAAIGDYRVTHPEQRAGQASFNVLVQLRPDLSEDIRGTVLDPFYLLSSSARDRVLLKEFFLYLKDNWKVDNG